jgi:hypothetical protein
MMLWSAKSSARRPRPSPAAKEFFPMDRHQFDALARLVSGSTSRRGALAALIGVSLVGREVEAHRPKGKRKVRAQAKAKTKTKAKTHASSCYPSTNCIPGKGRNTSGCDFANSTVFVQRDARGANLSNSNFTGADLSRADLRGTNLSGSCLVNATLRDARLGSSVNLGGAIFCNTVTPDGTIDNRGCNAGTACCPTCLPATCESLGKQCGSWPDGCGGTLLCGRCPLGDTPVCALDGTCVRCDALCDCGSCVTFDDGNSLCDTGDFSECGDPCDSHADCKNPDLPACVVSLTDRITNATTTLASQCGPPITVGACSALATCGP